MSYTVDAESVGFKILDLLGDNLSTKLTAIQTEKSDSIVLDNIRRYFFGDREDVPSSQNMPAIIVKVRSATPQPIAVDGRYRDEIVVEIDCIIDGNMNLAVTVDSRSYDWGEILDMKIMRYARAIVEILAENEQLGEKAVITNFSDVIVSNILPINRTMLKACRIELLIQGVTNQLGG